MQQTAGLQLTGHQAHSSVSLQAYSVYYRPTIDVQQPKKRTSHLQSAGCHQLFVPRHRRSMFGRRAFSVAGPAACNSLPDLYLRDPSRSADSFRRDLKTLLFSIYQRTQRIRGFARGLGWRRRERSFAVISRRKICSAGPPGPAGGACVPPPPKCALTTPAATRGGVERRDEIRDGMGRGIAAKTTSVE